MALQNNITVEKNKIVIQPLKAATSKMPIIIRKDSKIKLFQGDNPNEFLIKNIKFGPASMLYKEDVIYESKSGGFLGNSLFKITIVNKLNLISNTSRTIATYTDLHGKVISEKSSDQISKLIGQEKYDTILTTLCSEGLSEESKVKGILALLKEPIMANNNDIKKEKERELAVDPLLLTEEKCCQTDENCMDLIYKLKQKRRMKRSVLMPYPVKDSPSKRSKKVIVINPSTSENKYIIEDLDVKVKIETQKEPNVPETTNPIHIKREENLEPPDFPVISLTDAIVNLNDDSLDASDNISNFSVESNLLKHGENEILNTVIQHTKPPIPLNPSVVHMPDGTQIIVPYKPEDDFHIATPENLKNVSYDDSRKLRCYQALVDWKHCLQRDDDGYLPIHNAVLNKDVDMLRRQCLVIKNKKESVDITAGNMTALQMSIVQDIPECTAMLLQHGADPLYPDEEQRTALHLAAEGSSDQLRVILNRCEHHAREILEDQEELWKPEYETKSKEELASILLQHICQVADNDGYTALMLATKMGNYTNVKMLVEAAPASINVAMPNCGNTALFLAVSVACLDAAERGNTSKVADHFHRTISILIENGADPTIANHTGTNVNDLLSESNNGELSMLLAERMTSVKYFDGSIPSDKFDSYMLLKDEEGNVDIAEVNTKKPDKTNGKRTRKSRKQTDNSANQIGKSGNQDGKSGNQADKSGNQGGKSGNQSGKSGNQTGKSGNQADNSGNQADNSGNQADKSSNQAGKSVNQPYNSLNKTGNSIPLTPDIIKKEKPIILENIALPATSKAIFLTPKSISMRDVKILNPKDKLLSVKSVTDGNVINTSNKVAVKNVMKFTNIGINPTDIKNTNVNSTSLGYVTNVNNSSIVIQDVKSLTATNVPVESKQVVDKVRNEAVKRKSASAIESRGKKSKVDTKKD